MLVHAKLSGMEEDELQELRRSKLAAWLAENGGITVVAERCGLKPSGRSYLSQVTNGYSFGSRAARSWEKKLGLTPGWLDIQPDGDVQSNPPSQWVTSETSASYHTPPKKSKPTDQALQDALKVIGAALSATMEEDVRDDLADALAKLARRKGSPRDQEQVLHLLSSRETGTQRAA